MLKSLLMLHSHQVSSSITIRKICLDISKSPFNFQNKGFGRNLRVAEVGGPGNLFPKVEKDKEFDLKVDRISISL